MKISKKIKSKTSKIISFLSYEVTYGMYEQVETLMELGSINILKIIRLKMYEFE